MCGRFTIGKPKDIKSRFATSNDVTLFEPSWNVVPSQTIPTITRNSPNKIELMKWGMLFSKTAKFGSINIRSESTKEKPYFKRLLLTKRCIIPADSFYEWGVVNLEGKDEKYPVNFYLEDRPLFGFAGIYTVFADAEGKEVFSTALFTTTPNEIVKPVHNRMPVILQPEDEDAWLDPDQNDFDTLYKLLKPYPVRDMRRHFVSRRVNSPKNDDEALIEEVKLGKTGYGKLD